MKKINCKHKEPGRELGEMLEKIGQGKTAVYEVKKIIQCKDCDAIFEVPTDMIQYSRDKFAPRVKMNKVKE